MNRPVHYIEFRTPDQSLSLQALVDKTLAKINEPEERKDGAHWTVYINDRRVDNWNKVIRPKSRMVLVARFAHPIVLDVAFENRQIIILDKPEGLPTQPTLKSFEDNLFYQVKQFFIQQKHYPAGLPYVGLHHRLDRGTSGLVLMTKQRQVNREVSDLFKNRKISKEYQALVEWGDGKLPKEWTQDDPIERVSTKKKKFLFQVGPAGESAISQFKVIRSVPERYYQLACFPKTGRTHQLRVHLAHKGHPILGDSAYGRKKSANRMMLHAWKLKFTMGGEKYQIQSNHDLSKNY